MSSIYPTNFASLNGESYVDENGELTPIGEVWVHEIEKLDLSQIKTGMDNLRFRKNAQFAPSAVDFAAFCLDMSAEICAEEILEYIQSEQGSNWWWRTEAAFNVYIELGYSPARNQKDSQIVDDIKRIYRRLDLSNLKPIPEKSIGIPIREPSKIERNRGKFQGLVAFCIERLRPDLFLSAPTKDISHMSTKQVMAKFYETGRPLTDLVDFIAEMTGRTKDEKDTGTVHTTNQMS